METVKVKKKSKANPEINLLDLIISLIQDKNGHDIVCLDMKNITEAITDYFVICHGDSTPQTRAIIDHLEEEVKKQANIRPLHIEGRSNGEWCLIDFGDIVVHVFLREKREFYQLEELWSDAVITRYDD
ncbi:MAG TPA: ribosome silencing factor [Chitinophagales bacterium]|nr:ribosome silencing factor [Chitinophagales bacterium]